MSSEALLSTVWTTAGVAELLQIVDMLSNSLYRTGKQAWEEVLRSQVPAAWAPYLEVAPKARRSYLEGLKRQLQQLPVLRLTVAVDLPLAAVERMCTWVRDHVAADAVLEMTVDPDVVAGAEISFGGKYVDLSKRADLARILASYGKL